MKMYVLLHSGPGFISSMIRWQTRSPFNHASLLFSDGIVIESREFKGVQSIGVLRVLKAVEREARLRVDCYEVCDFTEDAVFSARHIAESIVVRACGYDYSSVLRFISRRRWRENDRWFCSELVAHVLQEAGFPLFNETYPSEIPPGWVHRSLALERAGTLAEIVERDRIPIDKEKHVFTFRNCNFSRLPETICA